MTTLAGVGIALPENRYPQRQITDAFAALCLGPGEPAAALRRVHTNSGVAHRHLALPIEQYPGLSGFTAANDAYQRVAPGLGARALRDALSAAGLAPQDLDLLIVSTVTGLAVPSLDARLVPLLGLRPDIRRLPLFGLGCVAGAAGIARLHDYLLGHPDGAAALVTVELCSLTVQRDDHSMANLVASALFGDGAAAVVAVGEDRAAECGGPRVRDTRSHLYPGTERTMGWDIGSTGLRIVLDATVPDLVHAYLGTDVRKFLADNGLSVSDVVAWISHPGGPKVIRAIETELGLAPDALGLTWRSLAAVGNLSSASVLHVLAGTLAERTPPSGSPGVLLAMGPGFCSELVLLQW